ncbi:LytR/AlgR family response regulator transcription factor [Spirosoma soli]|uniref:LytR/AlgR family response regulator transcription factor n=1 Tax=Spirosoma soli TaxID=1770529 RepID=A0ABW5M0A3_9BACT
MNVVLIEDERLTAQRLESLLHKYDPTIAVVATLPSVEKAVAWFGQPVLPAVDLVFMDIHLQDGLGFRIIQQTGLTTPIIFTTAYDEYMVQAFKVNSIDYLLKPINYAELTAAIDKFRALRLQFSAANVDRSDVPGLDALLRLLDTAKETPYKDRFMVTVGPKIYSVETADIAYFLLEERATFLVPHEGLHLPMDYSLDRLYQMLNPDRFFRVNRQWIVARPAIRSIDTYSATKIRLELLPKHRHEVFVSTERVQEFKVWLGK